MKIGIDLGGTPGSENHFVGAKRRAHAACGCAGAFNSRENIGGGALTVYNIDDPISEDLRNQLISDDRITDIYYISLNG